jgi:glycosyltransferase involved in cell wall biosynthesis
MKFAFITPRYGGEIASGAEHACRLLAEQVCERHGVDVLTTCATDAGTWKNDLTEGTDRVRGVLVRRFAVSQTHDREAFRQFTTRLLAGPHSRAEELEWVRRLGPVSPGLLDYLKRQHRSYDALVFFSLWHPTTVQGLHVAPERSVLFPYLQLRPALRFGIWGDVLTSARGIGYFSESERRLVRSYVRVMPQHEEIVGIGIDALPQQTYPRHQQDPADTLTAEDGPADEAPEEPQEPTYLEGRGIPFRRRQRLYGRFAVYSGRVAPDNGSEELLEYFDSYSGGSDAGSTDRGLDGRSRVAAGPRDSHSSDIALVLTGVKMKVPEDPNVRLAGVLPYRERMIAFEAADLSLAPDSDDLLGEALLESFAVGTPVLASAANDAAVEHCRRGNAGLYYANREEFVETLRALVNNGRLRRRLGENGRNYIRQNYRWEAVLGRFDRLIAKARPR